MSEELKVNGVIQKVGEIKEFGSKGFKSLKWVLKIPDGEYPQSVEFESTQKNAENFAKFNKVGDSVEVKFNLRGKEWTNKQGELVYFNSLNAWMVTKDASANKAEPIGALAASRPAESDDLPF
jgi:hypothetical protein